MKRLQRLMLLSIMLLSLIFSGESLATEKVNLFQAQVVVKDRSSREWRKGVRNALNQVLVKATGNPNISKVPEIEEAYKNFNNLVQSYSYHRKALYGQMSQTFLHVNFDPTEVKHALQNANQIVWNPQRPSTLIWLALQTSPNARYTEILSEDQYKQYVAILRGAADRRGIPIVLPKMDLTDISSVSAKDILNFNVPLLSEIGSRYHSDGMLVARVMFQDDQYWHVKCVWVSNGNQFEWEEQQTDLDDLMNNIVDRLSNEMAWRYISLRKEEDAHNVLIRVVGVNGLDEYSKVIDYLKTLEPIKDVQLESLESDSVILSINFGGDQENLNRTIINAKDHRLADVQFHAVDNSGEQNQNDEYRNHDKNIVFMYQWRSLDPEAS